MANRFKDHQLYDAKYLLVFITIFTFGTLYVPSMP